MNCATEMFCFQELKQNEKLMTTIAKLEINHN